MATTRDFIVKNGVQVLGVGSIAATNTGTGALVVSGGAGFNGPIYANGMYSSGSVVLTQANISGTAVVSIVAGTDTSVSLISAGTYQIWSTGTLQTVTGRGAATSNAIQITNGTDATALGTGSLVVSNGVSVGANLVVGAAGTFGLSSANNLKLSGAATLGAVTLASQGSDSSVGINITAKGNAVTAITSTLASATTSNNALYVAGGLGVAGSVYGGNIYDNSNRVLTSVVLNSGAGITVSNLGYSGSQQSFTIINSGVTATIGTTYLGVSASTGAVTFTNLGVQSLTAGADLSVTASTGTITINSTATLQSVTSRGATTNQVISITNAATSNTSTNGALVVTGGVGIGNNLNVGGTLNVWGATTFSGNVTFNGTATYVLSTNTVYTDNLINLHIPPGGVDANWNADDGKDIGHIFNYYNRTLSTDTRAALIFANDSQGLEFYNRGQESGGIFTGTSYGNFKLGSIQLTSTTANSNNATSGALQVAGGIGIAGDSWIGGTGGTASSTAVSNQGLIVNSAGLGVNGDSYFANNVGFGGNTVVAGNSLVTGVSTTTGASYLNGAVTANSTLGVAGNFNVTGTTVLTGALTANGGLAVTSETISGIFTSTNTSTAGGYGGNTGAIQTLGGASIAKDLYVGGNLNVQGTINATINGTSSLATTATNLSGATAGSVPYQSNNGITGYFGPGTAGTVLVSSGGGVNTPPIFQNTLTLAGATQSTSVSSGALQVAGGVGIGQNLYIGGNTNIAGVSTVTGASYLNGAVTANSTLGVAGNFNVTGTSILNGNVTANGTLGVVSNFNVTGTSILNGNVTANGTLGVAGNVNITGTTTLVGGASGSSLVLSGNLGVTGTTTFVGGVSITNATASTSTTTGALIVGGGIGVRGNAWIGGDLNVLGTIRMQGVGLDTISGSTGTFDFLIAEGTGTGLAVTNNVTIGGNLTATTLTVTGRTTLGDATAANTTVTTLTVTGNETVNGNLGVAANFNVTGTSVHIGAGYFDSTLGVKGNFNVTGTTTLVGGASGSSLVLSGNLGVTGTSVLSGTVTVGPASQYASYASASTTTNATMSLDSFSSTAYRTAKYVCQVADTGATPNKVQVEEFLVFHDNNAASTIAYIISYGIGHNTGELGTWDAVYAGGNITLQFTPNYTPSSLTVKTMRSAITV